MKLKLKILDNFINEFSHNINKLVKYEHTNKLNSTKHKLLFNYLLYLLFDRKQYALDYDCWIELYLRSLCFYQYMNKIGNIPLVLVTKHNEILPFYFKQKIHKINNTFIHFDTHPDFNYIDFSKRLPILYNNYLKTNNNDFIKKAQNIVWDIGAANSGVFVATGIRDTIWNMPSWVLDKPINLNYFFKEMKNGISFKTDTNIKNIYNLDEFAYVLNVGENSKTYAKIQSENLSKESLKNMVNLIKKNGNKFILDIDLDYFVCNGKPYDKTYKLDSFDVSSPNRTEHKDYEYKNPREIPKNNDDYIKYNKLLHIEIKQIEKRIKHFLMILKYLQKHNYIPSHISICDSTNVHFSGCETCNSISNNYVPINLALYVHTKVIHGLEKLYS